MTGLDTLSHLTYDPAALRIGAAHIGMGAFHRGHQQTYYDDLARAGHRDWGVAGINVAPPDIAAVHAAQNGVYSVLAEDQDDCTLRRIGTLRRADDRPDPCDPLWDEIGFATLTITEKGYCHVSGSTMLDTSSAIAADLATPDAPVTAVGFLAAMLDRRRRNGGAPITLASCDNVASNGALLRGVLTDFVARTRPGLVGWIEDNVAFPDSMVDRIVPRMSGASADRLARAAGKPDALGVVGEPYRQWVLADRFAQAPRPPLEEVGVQVVPDVEIFEYMKHRMLNGLQSAFAELGRLAGHGASHEAATDPALVAWARRFLAAQAETLTCPPGENLADYAATTLHRLANPTIVHPLAQIASDASFKLPQRIFAPAADRLVAGRDVALHASIVAGWIAQAGDATPDRYGVTVSDPGAARVAIARDAAGSARAVADAVIRAPLFPEALAASAVFKVQVADWLELIRAGDPDRLRARLRDDTRSDAHA
ncbi:mannitol dehydrogenase family protein [Roseovarius sp. MMSF_3281]|uniref:mannitol dehydrogenase family protein n=1 Tax=Roseovarius sp. MMSF_3281 TaxID=3046694 RepID=UPI00273DE0E2|nr:mannitol dehydrogenase family protein [Roseovarius sp. MMSF_3281]